jgi:murein DD-endopeptidase MepM/ murein hydrolase activator NlpD
MSACSRNKTLRSSILSIVVATMLATTIACGGSSGTRDNRIGPQGGVLESLDGLLTLSVPSGALAEPEELRVTVDRSLKLPGQIGDVYLLEPEGLSFTRPATLTIAYKSEELPEGVLAEHLRLATLGEKDSWQPLTDSVVNAQVMKVSASLEHFSLASLVATPPLNTRPPDFTLRFPLSEDVRINSIFDHSATSPYSTDRIVFAYTGEVGDRDQASCRGKVTGFRNEKANSFRINGRYYGAGEPTCLWYEGHPGYDYRTRDIASSGSTDVFAAADGIVRWGSDRWGTLCIDHRNGYSTCYLHLSTRAVEDGTEVTKGNRVGTSGDVGSPDQPHLHFELRWHANYVDPYGWQSLTCDPYGASTVSETYEDCMTKRASASQSFHLWPCSISVGEGARQSVSSAIANAFNVPVSDAFRPSGGVDRLGCPTTVVQAGGTSYLGTTGHFQSFSDGAIEYLSSGGQAGKAFALVNELYFKWTKEIADDPDEWPTTEADSFRGLGPVERALRVLGYPIANATNNCGDTTAPQLCRSSNGTAFLFQNFEGGGLELHLDGPRRGKVYEVHGAIFDKWRSVGFATHALGLPVSDEREARSSGAAGFFTTGRVSDFEHGHIHWHRDGPQAGQAFETHGSIDAKYVQIGGTASVCGFPRSDVYAIEGGEQVDFEGGYIRVTRGQASDCIPWSRTMPDIIETPIPATPMPEPPTAARPCPVADVSFCDFVYEIDAALRSGDLSIVSALTEFTPHSCSEFPDHPPGVHTFPPPACKDLPTETVINCIIWTLYAEIHPHTSCYTANDLFQALTEVTYSLTESSKSNAVVGISYICAPTGCNGTLYVRDPTKSLSSDQAANLGVVLGAVQRGGGWVLSSGGQGVIFYYSQPQSSWPP